jgi:hypothetical protein
MGKICRTEDKIQERRSRVQIKCRLESYAHYVFTPGLRIVFFRDLEGNIIELMEAIGIRCNQETTFVQGHSFLDSLDATLMAPLCHELLDRLEDTMINRVLRFTAALQLAFRDEQGMIAAFDNVQFVRGGDFLADGCEHVQGAERIASPLHKENRRREFAEDRSA